MACAEMQYECREEVHHGKEAAHDQGEPLGLTQSREERAVQKQHGHQHGDDQRLGQRLWACAHQVEEEGLPHGANKLVGTDAIANAKAKHTYDARALAGRSANVVIDCGRGHGID
eukprot:CAMPEP_0179130126 /NCGR_PEP_ID=MMETSP0796-20121207/61765_1 /TAXON_ID=73915 /ORGANISM="Pyrodinium bahamense, Strain pbaha01" /LENGTH=114 /DNA_ID=CAMNT_0020829019 /DNA_START=1055 /DNA_END=1397 /DNA_ORIENTATION=+